MRPQRQYVDDLNAVESLGVGLALLDGTSRPLAWPSTTTVAAARLARAWGIVKMEAERGRPSDLALIEMYRAGLRLMSATGAKDLWSAIDAVGEIEA